MVLFLLLLLLLLSHFVVNVVVDIFLFEVFIVDLANVLAAVVNFFANAVVAVVVTFVVTIVFVFY
jgi:hypothetical protein